MQLALRGDGWTRLDGVAVRGRAFDDGTLLEGEALAARFVDAVSSRDERLEAVAAATAALEGFYAAVVTCEDDTATLVADGARSIPLYYDAEGTVVSDRGRIVRDAIGADRDPVAESEFLLARYVTGPETIWRGVRAVRPGEVVRLAEGEVTRRTYREYWPAGPADGDLELGSTGRSETALERTVDRLEAALETALDRLERVAGDRPIVLPLSGGYDSRLLAAALVERGREVIGFTFGRSGHPDVEVSREVAARLGIRWEFCPYDESLWREWYHGDAARRYRERAFGGDALPFLAEWPALRLLLADGRLPADGLYCPGHTVATPSERLPTFAGESSSSRVAEPSDSSSRTAASRSSERATDRDPVGCGPAVDATDTPEPGGDGDRVEPSVDGLLEYVLETHYTLWEWDDDAFRTAARERIRRGLLGDREPAAITDPASAAAGYERWEWRGRMSTFTNGDLRAYEDAGVDWWLPLWDPAYVRAWERAPLEARRGKYAHAALAVRTYHRVADVPAERAAITDRTLSPVDRHLALVRHTPARQFGERDGDWDPPFLAPRSAWGQPGSHPLAWDGAVDETLLEALSDARNFYALRTLAETGRLEVADSDGSVPQEPLALPTGAGE